MGSDTHSFDQALPNGVMLNAYPDSVGERLSDMVGLLKRPELEGAFSLFYILPTFFNSDLDRGFSVVDYDLNTDLVSSDDLRDLDRLGVMCKLDLVLNHLSVASPQFKDLLVRGDESEYKNFFVDWNAFWEEHGVMGEEGYVVPNQDHLDKLFMRKPGLPILKVRFPDGSERPYWNTFYQQVSYEPLSPADLAGISGVGTDAAHAITEIVNAAIERGEGPDSIDLDGYSGHLPDVLSVVQGKRSYLGQMDLNARSEKVWEFYDETLAKLHGYGAKIIRLDAFAYLHKVPGEANFFNRPGTWDYLDRLREVAKRHNLIVFPEIHAEYGKGLHEEVAARGFPIYDFFFPGLVIDALDRGTSRHLIRWIDEVQDKGIQTINMLGCHDGIPVLDLRGWEHEDYVRPGLLQDTEIDAVMDRIIERGGLVKNLYGADGKKIAYYQVNATFFSALGEDELKLRLARAIQMFMPGIPQVWYLDLFAGTNDFAAVKRGGPAGHKEINRTNLSIEAAKEGLGRQIVKDQLALIRLRNRSPAFRGKLEVHHGPDHILKLSWHHPAATATLTADLADCSFSITDTRASGETYYMDFESASYAEVA